MGAYANKQILDLKTWPKGAVDWELLFDEWIKSKEKKAKFLREKGFDPTDKAVKKKTRKWTIDLKMATRNIRKATDKDGLKPMRDISELWHMVQGWRRRQAPDDWKTADALRSHLKMILNENTVKDKHGKHISELRPQDLEKLANVALSIQKIQRLALGMSTENIGVDRPDTQVETPEVEDTGEVIPIYHAEVNVNGKWVRSTPRRVK